MNKLESILYSLITVVIALVGATIPFLFKINHHKLCALISFSAGVLMAIAVFIVVPEAIENVNIFISLILLAIGYLIFFLVSRYVFHVCPACAASHFDLNTTKKFSEIARAMIIAFSLHSFFDGIALSSGGVHSKHVHFDVMSILFALAIHKLPEGLALASLMLSTDNNKKVIFRNVFLIESITILGAIFGEIFINKFVPMIYINWVMIVIAGSFIYLSLHAILGELLQKHTKLVLAFYSAGLLLIYLVHSLIH